MARLQGDLDELKANYQNMIRDHSLTTKKNTALMKEKDSLEGKVDELTRQINGLRNISIVDEHHKKNDKERKESDGPILSNLK